MAYDTIPAHNFKIQVNTGTAATPVWTPVLGINTITPAPSKREADTTTFDTAGWDRSTVVSRGLTITASGHAMYDEDGAKDPGQMACEALSQETGSAARGEFRILTPGDKAVRFTGDVTVTEFGGGAADVASWNLEVKVSEQPTVMTVA